VPRTAKVVAFSTTPQMAAEIDRIAAEEGRTRSELLREAVRAYGAARGDGAAVAAEARAAYAPSTLSAAPSLPGLALVLARRADIAALCREAGVARLWVFGSAVRDDFDPDHSDFDFLVEFREDAERKPWLGEIFELQDALSAMLGRAVDLGEAGWRMNNRVRTTVETDKVLVYEHA
jgi:predicted nucleotidyltransferase